MEVGIAKAQAALRQTQRATTITFYHPHPHTHTRLHTRRASTTCTRTAATLAAYLLYVQCKPDAVQTLYLL